MSDRNTELEEPRPGPSSLAQPSPRTKGTKSTSKGSSKSEKSKASSHKSSSTMDKDAIRHLKALEKQFAKAQKALLDAQDPLGQSVENIPMGAEAQDWPPDNISESQAFQAACFEEDFSPFQGLQIPGEDPPVCPWVVEPSATAIATAIEKGLHPPEVPGLTQELQVYISEAILQGVELAFQRREARDTILPDLQAKYPNPATGATH